MKYCKTPDSIRKFERGFSLIETMAVLGVVSVLTAGSFQAVKMMTDSSARANIKSVLSKFASTSSRTWYSKNNFSENSSTLKTLLNPLATGNCVLPLAAEYGFELSESECKSLKYKVSVSSCESNGKIIASSLAGKLSCGAPGSDTFAMDFDPVYGSAVTHEHKLSSCVPYTASADFTCRGTSSLAFNSVNEPSPEAPPEQNYFGCTAEQAHAVAASYRQNGNILNIWVCQNIDYSYRSEDAVGIENCGYMLSNPSHELGRCPEIPDYDYGSCTVAEAEAAASQWNSENTVVEKIHVCKYGTDYSTQDASTCGNVKNHPNHELGQCSVSNEDSNNQDSNNQDSNNQDSNNEDSNNEDSNNEDSNNEDSNNEDSNNEDSNNEDSNNEDSNNEDSNNEDSNNEDSNNEDSNNEDSNNEDSNNEDSNNEESDSSRDVPLARYGGCTLNQVEPIVSQWSWDNSYVQGIYVCINQSQPWRQTISNQPASQCGNYVADPEKLLGHCP